MADTADELIEASGIEVTDCAQVNADRAALAGMDSSSACSTTDGKGYVTAFVGIPAKGITWLANNWEGDSVKGDDWFLSIASRLKRDAAEHRGLKGDG